MEVAVGIGDGADVDVEEGVELDAG